MFLNDLVNLPHQWDPLLESHDDALVAFDILGSEGAAWLTVGPAMVVEPLVAHLLAAIIRVWAFPSSSALSTMKSSAPDFLEFSVIALVPLVPVFV
jgi:hypothetical protein